MTNKKKYLPPTIFVLKSFYNSKEKKEGGGVRVGRSFFW